MCIQAIGVIAALAGTAVSAMGAIQQGNAQAAAMEAQAQQNRNNAVIAQRNAEDARQRGVAAEQDLQIKGRARIAMQKNVLSERNIALAGGSALDLLGDTAMFSKMDALTTRGNFEREAISHEAQRGNYNAQADLDLMEAQAARRAGTISAFSTALSGIGSVAQNYQRRMTL